MFSEWDCCYCKDNKAENGVLWMCKPICEKCLEEKVKMLTCDGCGVALTHGVRYKGSYKCKDCIDVVEVSKYEWNEVGNLKKQLDSMIELTNERGSKIQELEEELENQKEISKQLHLYNGKEENDKLIKKLESMTELANERGNKIKELEEENEKMKESKCCKNCEDEALKLVGVLIKRVLPEDCMICKGESGCNNEFCKLISETSYVFEDSWRLVYKVKGIDNPIQHLNLTKEECEIIYGNMNNITYWVMELMG